MVNISQHWRKWLLHLQQKGQSDHAEALMRRLLWSSVLSVSPAAWAAGWRGLCGPGPAARWLPGTPDHVPPVPRGHRRPLPSAASSHWLFLPEKLLILHPRPKIPCFTSWPTSSSFETHQGPPLSAPLGHWSLSPPDHTIHLSLCSRTQLSAEKWMNKKKKNK